MSDIGKQSERNEHSKLQAFLVDDLDVHVRMHESRTSAMATFVDDRGREQRVSLVAQRGGGAIMTQVPKRYEKTMRVLGMRLWPMAHRLENGGQ
jgi:hypothetical protein